MRTRILFAFAFLALFLVAAACHAQTPASGTVSLAWGDLVAGLIDKGAVIIVALTVAAWGMVAAQLPGWVKPIVATLRVEQLLMRAVQSALARARASVAGQDITVAISEPIIADAVAFVFSNGSDKLLEFVGTDLPGLVEKILARMQAQGVTVPGADPVKIAENIAPSVAPFRPPGA